MKTQDFLDQLEKNYKDAHGIMIKKNKDYASDGQPFSNFKGCEIIGVEYKKGILVRVLDKIKRVSNLLEKDPDVKDESIEDTLLDIMNYTNIILTAIQYEKDKIQEK